MLIVVLLCVLILLVTFGMMTGERKSEFALLRMLGYARGRLLRVIMGEACVISAAGSCLGAASGTVVVLLFSNAIAARLSLPFMVPQAGQLALIAGLSLAATLLAGISASAWSAARLSRIDTGILMQEGH